MKHRKGKPVSSHSMSLRKIIILGRDQSTQERCQSQRDMVFCEENFWAQKLWDTFTCFFCQDTALVLLALTVQRWCPALAVVISTVGQVSMADLWLRASKVALDPSTWPAQHFKHTKKLAVTVVWCRGCVLIVHHDNPYVLAARASPAQNNELQTSTHSSKQKASLKREKMWLQDVRYVPKYIHQNVDARVISGFFLYMTLSANSAKSWRNQHSPQKDHQLPSIVTSLSNYGESKILINMEEKFREMNVWFPLGKIRWISCRIPTLCLP